MNTHILLSSLYNIDLCHISCDFNLHHNFIATGLQLDNVIFVDLAGDPITAGLFNFDEWAITTCVHDLKSDWFVCVKQKEGNISFLELLDQSVMFS